MVNSGSFDSDVDRNEKGEITQLRRVAETPQSVSTVHGASRSLCENDFSTQTADSLPVSQAIEPTATKTEYKCNMSDLLMHAGKALTSQCITEDAGVNEENIVERNTYETLISSEQCPTETPKSYTGKVNDQVSSNKFVAGCNVNKILSKDGTVKAKVSVCCSVPLEKVQDVLKACSTSTVCSSASTLESKKQTSKKDMCLYCDRSFITSNLKQRHVERYHSMKYNRRLSARRQVVKHSVTACMFCNKLNNVECSLTQLFEHLVLEHPKKYFGCLECEARFPSFQVFQSHLIRIHGISKESMTKQNDLTNKSEEKINLVENRLALEKLTKPLNNRSNGDLKEYEEKTRKTKIAENTVSETNNAAVDPSSDRDEQRTCVRLKNKCKSKHSNDSSKGEEEKLKSLPSVSVALEPIEIYPNDKSCVLNSNNYYIKAKSKVNWVKELRSKKVAVVSTKMGIKQCLRITRQQSKILENVKNSKRKSKADKNDHINKTSITSTKYLSFQNNPYPAFDFAFRVKKITDHSIDNIKISSMTFDDVFDKAFFNRVKCNIQDNLLNYIDGKLFKSVESENRISSFQKLKDLQVDEPSQTYGCKISTSAVTPVAALLTDSQFGEDIESHIEYGVKPSKKKATVSVTDVHYKYFTRRKYQAVVSENNQNRDLSKLDMWTQLAVKNRQQKILCEQKTEKEILEYRKSQEYQVKMQIEELDRILDKRGPIEDLKEEVMRTVALEKLNGTVVDTNIESYFDVTVILNELLNSLFTVDTSPNIMNNCETDTALVIQEPRSQNSPISEEIPNMLNLRRISKVPSKTVNDKLPTSKLDENTMVVELTGEWARSRIYVCAACGVKMPNAKLLIDHKNLFHEHVWCQHYEFVGNQGELYRHLSIPGLGKVGEIENSGSKMWRRSEARMCSKCDKRFNCLGDLHRHVLECGGDWSWMLARKKYKYRPYGSKPRKRRRGLLKFLHAFRERKEEQPREKGKPIKKFDGPRQKPSDADTIQRMLANLPAKRATRKIISLKDGFQRTMKNQKISKTNQNNPLRKNKMQINKTRNKTSQKNQSGIQNPKKSLRLLRSNSNTKFENKTSMILPKFKQERKEDKHTNSSIRRHSVRNISRVLANKLTKSNTSLSKRKFTDEPEKIKKNDKIITNPINDHKDQEGLNKNQNVSGLPYKPKNSKKKCLKLKTEIKSKYELQPEDGEIRKHSKGSNETKTIGSNSFKTVCKKSTPTKKKQILIAKSNTVCDKNSSETAVNIAVVTSAISKKVKKRNKPFKGEQTCKKSILNQSSVTNKLSNRKNNKLSSKLCNTEKESSIQSSELHLVENNVDCGLPELVTTDASSHEKNIKIKKKTNKKANIPADDTDTGKVIISESPKEIKHSCMATNTKNKYINNFSLKKSKAQNGHKNVNTNIRSSCRRKNIVSKPTSMLHNLKTAPKKSNRIRTKNKTTKIIQVDGSSQSKPSTRSKLFRKELYQSRVLCGPSRQEFEAHNSSPTLGDITQLVESNNRELVSQAKCEVNKDPGNETFFPTSSNHLFNELVEAPTTEKQSDSNLEIHNTQEINSSAANEKLLTRDILNLQNQEKGTLDMNSTSVSTSVTKKKLKKQRGLNDCIAMLTNKLQDKHVFKSSMQDTETSLTNVGINELPQRFVLGDIFPQNNKNDIENTDLLLQKNTDQICSENIGTSKLESVENKEYGIFELESKIEDTCDTSIEIFSGVWEIPDNRQHLRKQLDSVKTNEVTNENTTSNESVLYDYTDNISQTNFCNYKNTTREELPRQRLTSFSEENKRETAKEILENVNQSVEEQYCHIKINDDIKISEMHSFANRISKSELISEVAVVNHANHKTGVSQHFSQNCNISIPKEQVNTVKFKTCKLKPIMKKLKTSLQNNSKTLKDRFCKTTKRKHKSKQMDVINDSRETCSNSSSSITTIVNNSTLDVKPILSGTSEEYSNSGKENVAIREQIKVLKHKKTKNKKLPENSNNLNFRRGEQLKLSISINVEDDLKPSDANEFVDSDDDVPLAEFVKKSNQDNVINTKFDIKSQNLELCQKTLFNENEIGKDVYFFLENLKKSKSCLVEEECEKAEAQDANAVYLATEEQVNMENCSNAEVKSNNSKARRCKNKVNLTSPQNLTSINTSGPKLHSGKLKSEQKSRQRQNKTTGKIKSIQIKNLKNKNETSTVLSNPSECCESLIENDITIESLKEDTVQLNEDHGFGNNYCCFKKIITSEDANSNDSSFRSNVVDHVLCTQTNREVPFTRFNYENQEDFQDTAQMERNNGMSKHMDNDTKPKHQQSENSNDIDFTASIGVNHKTSTNYTINDAITQLVTAEDQPVTKPKTASNVVTKTSTLASELFSLSSAVTADDKLKSKSKGNLKTKTVKGKKNLKCQTANMLSNVFCEICNKTFSRSENLVKHKRTLTHIAKLSELEALQAAKKLIEETATEDQSEHMLILERSVEDCPKHDLNLSNGILHDVDLNVNVTGYEYQKTAPMSTPFALSSSPENLKLVDIISDVLSKPVDDDFVKHSSFSDLILQSDREIKRCKSLGERKSFDSDKLQSFSNTSSTHALNLDENFGVSKLSNTADIIVEKQISLLENMIEDNRINFKSTDEMFLSSKIPANEEYSNQSNASEFSMLSSSKPEDCNDITFTHNTNIITNLIKPTLDDDNLIQSTRYEEISEDSNSSHFRFEDQKTRKALNRDEELFLECCSLLKSSSDVSDLCKKSTKSAKFLNNFGLKPLDELEWLEQKQFPTKKSTDFGYISNNFISDDSHINASVSDNFYNDLSYSNSNMSNCNLNLKALLDKNDNDNLFSQPPIFEDISTESDGSSRKSLENCFKNFKTITSTAALNGQNTELDRLKITNRISPSVESAQIPEEYDQIKDGDNEENETFGYGLSDTKSTTTTTTNDFNADLPSSLEIKVPVSKRTQAHGDFPAAKKKNIIPNPKMLTKGAMKVFEGLKVSIPKDGLDMKEVLSCSPTSKRLKLELEQGNTDVKKKMQNEKIIKHVSKLNKFISNSSGIKRVGNKLGLKITKKRYLQHHQGSLKLKECNVPESVKKSHDVYDFEETQDNMDVFTHNSNILPIYRSFRNKISDQSTDECRGILPIDKKSAFEFSCNEDKSKKLHFGNGYIDTGRINQVDQVLSGPLPKSTLASKKINVSKSITKNKCMIMGRIFKNAAKSKIVDEIKNIPAIENSTIVENFVLNCQEIQPDNEDGNKEHKLSEEEMNVLFDNLLNEEKLENTTDSTKDKNNDFTEGQICKTVSAITTTKSADHKPKQKSNKCKKRQRGNSPTSSDEEFSIKKFPRRHSSKKNSTNSECVINLEQELKECIGVASRKSQRKCTSGKQNVLVEYWSSDESNFGIDEGITPINDFENIIFDTIENAIVVSTSQNLENSLNEVIIDNESLEIQPNTLTTDTLINACSATSNPKKKKKDASNRRSCKSINSYNIDKTEHKIHKTTEICPTVSISEDNNSQTIASTRQKRSAVDTLYYWSSSSEDELQDIIEIKPLREEYDEENRPLQHGWIVGDSPKKLVTMLAQAKGKKVDVECVKKNKNKRTSV